MEQALADILVELRLISEELAAANEYLELLAGVFYDFEDEVDEADGVVAEGEAACG